MKKERILKIRFKDKASPVPITKMSPEEALNTLSVEIFEILCLTEVYLIQQSLTTFNQIALKLTKC